MKTQIDLLTETENILLTLLAQYKSGQYVLLAKSIANIRALKAGWECDWCGLSKNLPRLKGIATMDYYKCENCGKVFDEFEMNYHAAQIDKKCWCRACRKAAQQGVQADGDYCDCPAKLPPLDLGDGMGACPSCNRLRH